VLSDIPLALAKAVLIITLSGGISEDNIALRTSFFLPPIIEEIPVMLPDELRKEKEDKEFLEKWKEKVPENILKNGIPYHL